MFNTWYSQKILWTDDMRRENIRANPKITIYFLLLDVIVIIFEIILIWTKNVSPISLVRVYWGKLWFLGFPTSEGKNGNLIGSFFSNTVKGIWLKLTWNAKIYDPLKLWKLQASKTTESEDTAMYVTYIDTRKILLYRNEYYFYIYQCSGVFDRTVSRMRKEVMAACGST